MIEDVVEGFFRVLGRFIGQIFVDVIFEFLIKGPGYLVCRLFSKGETDPDSFLVFIMGILFWFVVGFGGYLAFIRA